MEVKKVIVGVDVGGTNTDAVVIHPKSGNKHEILSKVKTFTTADITTGVQLAVTRSLNEAQIKYSKIAVLQVNIGTTHFVNAVVQLKNLAKVSVIRLCGTSSIKLPPFGDFPEHILPVVQGKCFLVNGGYQFDGKEISPVDDNEIVSCLKELKSLDIKHIVVSGIFSSVRCDQELKVKHIIDEHYPEASITLSHTLGQLGILERENAAILNECIKPLCQITIKGFRSAIKELGLECPLFLTQNDGTIISEEHALKYPVYSFASGPTNSMRGAAFLSGVKDAIVVDIGGTTSDIGVIKSGFPREASSQVRIAGIRTNIRMSDVISIGLGGGSYVGVKKDETGKIVDVSVGPLSSGYNLQNEAYVFADDGNISTRKITATDIAVAAGLTKLGNGKNTSAIPEDVVTLGIAKIKVMLETVIDQMRFSGEEMPIIFVGGGSILVDMKNKINGACQMLIPDHYDAANAVGAALSQVSGTVDHIINLAEMVDDDELQRDIFMARLNSEPCISAVEERFMEEKVRKKYLVQARSQALEESFQQAKELAILAGAKPETVAITEKSDVALSYLPGNATRIKVKVVGDLQVDVTDQVLSLYCEKEVKIYTPSEATEVQKQTVTASGQSFDSESERSSLLSIYSEPHIDNMTGEWILSEWDIECISIGAGILGCGGGGSPYIGRVLALRCLREGKKIRVKTPDIVYETAHAEKDIFLINAFMGAPLIFIEKLKSGNDTIAAMECLMDLFRTGDFHEGILKNMENVVIKEETGLTYIDDYRINATENLTSEFNNKRLAAVLSAEIGGINSFEPLLVSAESNLPVVDCDGMGRAFPELQMFAPLIYGMRCYPSTLADDTGRRAVVLKCDDPKRLENHFRNVVVEMGCSAAVVLSFLNKEDLMNKTVKYSLSRAWRIGSSVLKARMRNESPVNAIIKQEKGKLLIVGKISDVLRETTGGFNRGFLNIEGLENYQGKYVSIEFQNEFLLARSLTAGGQFSSVLACVPDLIAVVDSDTGYPIVTEDIRYGLRVTVIAMASSPMMTSEQALKFVGPQAFGFPEDVKYIPVSEYVEFGPVGPISL
ncbi:hypothetical protein ACJMK2_010851 [Sinanodonta woodiana]|uniref:Hydantoinase n=1 Tax=Sinanodonta woodiana TaxID=1069815 RepID=A0ABD3VGR2_SINWO